MDDSPELAATTERKTPGRPTDVPFTRRAEGRAYVANRTLTRGEKAFAQYVVQGWPLWRCYVNASGSGCTKHAAEQQAWRWKLRPAVANEIQRLRASQSEATALHRVEKRNLLAGIARDPDAPQTARIQAIIVDNRMTGEDEPQRAAGQSAVVVFTVDPIGEGTRGLRQAEEQKTLPGPAGHAESALPNAAQTAPYAESALTPDPSDTQKVRNDKPDVGGGGEGNPGSGGAVPSTGSGPA